MFFSVDILSKNKGPLGKVWLAANLSSGSAEKELRLSKRDYCSVDVHQACEDITYPSKPFALRLSSCLLLGVVRIHQKQTQYLYFDLKDLYKRVKITNHSAIDLPPAKKKARFDAITLPDPLNNDLSFSLGDISIDFALSDADYILGMIDRAIPPTPSSQLGNCSSYENSPFTADPKDITMSEDLCTPLECLEVSVPGQNDFGEFCEELVQPSGPVTLLDNIPMPVLNQQQSIGQPIQNADCGDMEGVLLFDDNKGLFEVHKDTEMKTPIKDATLTPVQSFVSPYTVERSQAQPDPSEGITQARRFKTSAKRKLTFDKAISLERSVIKSNIRDDKSTLRPKKKIPGKVKPNALLFQPACDIIKKSKVFLPLWKRCAVIKTTTTSSTTGGLLPGEIEQERMQENGGDPHSSSKSTSHIEGLRDHSQNREEHSYNISHGEAASAFSDSSLANSTQSRGRFSFNTSSATRNNKGGQFVPQQRGDLSPIPDVCSDMELTLVNDFNLSDDDDDHTPTQQLVDGGYAPFSSDGVAGTLNTPRIKETPQSEPEAFYRQISGVLGDRSVEFQQLLPEGAIRKHASRAFANMLSLVSRGVLSLTQNEPYGAIMLGKIDHS